MVWAAGKASTNPAQVTTSHSLPFVFGSFSFLSSSCCTDFYTRCGCWLCHWRKRDSSHSRAGAYCLHPEILSKHAGLDQKKKPKSQNPSDSHQQVTKEKTKNEIHQTIRVGETVGKWRWSSLIASLFLSLSISSLHMRYESTGYFLKLLIIFLYREKKRSKHCVRLFLMRISCLFVCWRA